MPGSHRSLLSRVNWWAGSQCWPPVQPPCCSVTPPTCQRCSSSTSNSRARLKARRQLLRHRKPRRAAQEVTRTVAVQIPSRLEWLTGLGLDAWVRMYYCLVQKNKSLSGAIEVVQTSASSGNMHQPISVRTHRSGELTELNSFSAPHSVHGGFGWRSQVKICFCI